MAKKIILIGLLVFGWWYSRGIVKANSIECYTQYGICSSDITEKLTWLSRTPLLFPLPHQKVTRQLSQFTQVKKAKLYRRLPSTLVVSIDLRKPLGIIGPQVLGTKAIADEEGVVIGLVDSSTLPQLVADVKQPGYKIGDRISGLEGQAMKVLSEIGSISSKQIIGRLQDSKLEVLLSESPTQIWLDINYLPPNWKDSLQLILDRSKIQSKVLKIIDLRFTNPILSY